ncbi:MAG: helix-hairpin-helix domain-containing protein [Gammaproteobacteria bacterium]
MHFIRHIFFVSCLLLLPFMVHSSPVVDINAADSETLVDLLDGVGPQKAMAIIRYRQENGLFKTVDGLTGVKGIGKKTVEINRSRIKEITPQAAAK